MGWGDVHHCFAMAILVIIIITSPRTQSGDVLLFYVSFSLLLLLFLLRHPERSRVTYCYSTFLFSVWQVTCYDHFCVFQFFSILAVSMATAAILKKSTLTSTTSHGI
jgi:hypothetical protein